MTAGIADSTTVDVRGERLVLLPERAIYWQRERILFVADPHFGKAATFRVGGIPVPSGTTFDALSRLSRATARTMAERVVFLGDLLHAKAGRSAEMFETLGQWRAAHPRIEMALVRGNHDRRAGDPPRELGVECFDAPHVIAPFALAHHPAASDAGFVLSGHVHPGVRLYGRGGQRERLPCFVFARDWAILPAFGDFTGLADAEPGADCDVYAIADDAVIRVTSRA